MKGFAGIVPTSAGSALYSVLSGDALELFERDLCHILGVIYS